MNQPTDQFVLIDNRIHLAFKYLASLILSQLGDIDSSLAPKSIELVHTLPIHYCLPPEILVNIFSYLSFNDLFRVERVCKQWRELSKHAWLMKRQFGIYTASQRVSLGVLATKCPNIRIVDFRGYFFDAQSQNIVASIALNCPHIEEVNLSSQTKLLDEQVKALFVHCKKMKKIDLTFNQSLTGECLLYAKNMTYLALNHCTEIRNVNLVYQFLINNKSTLTSFHFNNYLTQYSPAILKFIAEIPNITELSLSLTGMDDMDKLVDLAKLEKLDLACFDLSNSKSLSKLMGKSRSLKILELDIFNSDDLFTFDPITAPLEYLSLVYSANFTDSTLDAIASNFSGSLKTLKLRQCLRFSVDAIVETVKRLPGLVLIDMCFVPAFAESHLLSIVEACEDKPWPVTVSCAATHVNYENFYEALLRKSSASSELRVKQVSHLIYDIYYKNVTIWINVVIDLENLNLNI